MSLERTTVSQVIGPFNPDECRQEELNRLYGLIHGVGGLLNYRKEGRSWHLGDDPEILKEHWEDGSHSGKIVQVGETEWSLAYVYSESNASGQVTIGVCLTSIDVAMQGISLTPNFRDISVVLDVDEEIELCGCFTATGSGLEGDSLKVGNAAIPEIVEVFEEVLSLYETKERPCDC